MSQVIRQIEPTAVWNRFADLNAVPRPSKKEARVIAFMKAFGESLNLPVVVDEIGNLIIKKPATAGMENRVTVCLQGHLDMVHQKNAETVFDFDKQGIDMYIDGDWVRAKGTTLGADNGLGVASIMAILASSDIPHPAIEALFTIDEETGMTGALGLQGGLLDAEIMLNLDTEEDDELTIGCAGGIDITGTGVYKQTKPLGYQQAFKIVLKGLKGGHSGIDIHRGRANANKLMNRILYYCSGKYSMQLERVDGGSLRNAIPRESMAVVVIPKVHLTGFKKYIAAITEVFKAEYGATDPNLEITIESVRMPEKVMYRASQRNFLQMIYMLDNGIHRMDSNIEGLVQTSNNLARVLVKLGEYSVQCLARSSVNTEKMDFALKIQLTMQSYSSTIRVTTGGEYPGWTPNPHAKIVEIMRNLYTEMNGAAPHVNACHAGLECGILGKNYPKMEMISFGPTIRGAHSPDEAASISSTQKFWKYLLATLAAIPEKG
jgi:dipeptidase D